MQFYFSCRQKHPFKFRGRENHLCTQKVYGLEVKIIKMINKQCLICHGESEKHEITNIYESKQLFVKDTLEKIIHRRLFQDKFSQYQLCTSCFKSVKDYEALQQKIFKVTYFNNFIIYSFDFYYSIILPYCKFIKNFG